MSVQSNFTILDLCTAYSIVTDMSCCLPGAHSQEQLPPHREVSDPYSSYPHHRGGRSVQQPYGGAPPPPRQDMRSKSTSHLDHADPDPNQHQVYPPGRHAASASTLPHDARHHPPQHQHRPPHRRGSEPTCFAARPCPTRPLSETTLWRLPPPNSPGAWQ